MPNGELPGADVVRRRFELIFDAANQICLERLDPQSLVAGVVLENRSLTDWASSLANVCAHESIVEVLYKLFIEIHGEADLFRCETNRSAIILAERRTQNLRHGIIDESGRFAVAVFPVEGYALLSSSYNAFEIGFGSSIASLDDEFLEWVALSSENARAASYLAGVVHRYNIGSRASL